MLCSLQMTTENIFVCKAFNIVRDFVVSLYSVVCTYVVMQCTLDFYNVIKEL